MLLTDINAEPARLPLPEPDLREAVRDGRLTQVTLRGVTPDGFRVEGIYRADSGLTVPAVLVNRSGACKNIKCPERALEFLRRLGVEEFEVDVSRWDPGQAFNPARESYLSRERTRLYGEANARADQLAAQSRRQGYRTVGERDAAVERLDQVVAQLSGRASDELDIRAVVICWSEVYLNTYPTPERAQRALAEFARRVHLEANNLERQLADCCSDEFKRRCKNQYLASLDLGGGN